MSLAERIAAAAPTSRKSLFSLWLDELSAADREAVDRLALDADWSNLAIVQFLKSEGVPIGKDAVAAWRASCGFRR